MRLHRPADLHLALRRARSPRARRAGVCSPGNTNTLEADCHEKLPTDLHVGVGRAAGRARWARSSANTPSTAQQQRAHGPGGVVPAAARTAARRARGDDAFDAGHFAEIDGQVFGRRRERCARCRPPAAACRCPRDRSGAAPALRGVASSTSNCEPAMVMTSPAMTMRAPPHGHAVDADAALGRGIEQPASGHRAQRGQRRRIRPAPARPS